MYIEVCQNDGIISTGKQSDNTIIHHHTDFFEPINWDRLRTEIHTLEQSSDVFVKQFAAEATEAVNRKDTGKIKEWLSKWMPCISKLIETSYYILEIAGRFGLGK